MTDNDQLVWAAAGSLARETLVPGPRTEAWAAVKTILEQWCGERVTPYRIRTLGVLWGLLKGALPRGGVPGGTTWGRMFGAATMAGLVAAMGKGRGDEGLRIATWNPRWVAHTLDKGQQNKGEGTEGGWGWDYRNGPRDTLDGQRCGNIGRAVPGGRSGSY